MFDLTKSTAGEMYGYTEEFERKIRETAGAVVEFHLTNAAKTKFINALDLQRDIIKALGDSFNQEDPGQALVFGYTIAGILDHLKQLETMARMFSDLEGSRGSDANS